MRSCLYGGRERPFTFRVRVHVHVLVPVRVQMRIRVYVRVHVRVRIRMRVRAFMIRVATVSTGSQNPRDSWCSINIYPWIERVKAHVVYILRDGLTHLAVTPWPHLLVLLLVARKLQHGLFKGLRLCASNILSSH